MYVIHINQNISNELTIYKTNQNSQILYSPKRQEQNTGTIIQKHLRKQKINKTKN